MKATLTLNKGRGSLTHNARTAKEKNQTWADSLTGSNIWLCDRCSSSADLRKMYQEEFGSALKKYNQSQISRGHSERQIRDYYDKIRNSKQENLTYSFVYQIGELDLIHKGSEEEQHCIDALRDIGIGFEERNPSFRVAQSVIHCDEKGIAHLHLVFIPVSEGNKRGMETKNSFVGALRDMGYKGQENYKQWRNVEVEACEKIMMAHGIERIQSRNHENLIHDMEIYKQMKANEERIAKISPKETVLGHFSDKVVLQHAEYEILRKTAENGIYVDAVKSQTVKDRQNLEKKLSEFEKEHLSAMNQLNNERIALDKRQKKLTQEEKRLSDWSDRLDIRESNIRSSENLEELAEDGMFFRSFTECLARMAYRHKSFFEDYISPMVDTVQEFFPENGSIDRFIELFKDSYEQIVEEQQHSDYHQRM